MTPGEKPARSSMICSRATAALGAAAPDSGAAGGRAKTAALIASAVIAGVGASAAGGAGGAGAGSEQAASSRGDRATVSRRAGMTVMRVLEWRVGFNPPEARLFRANGPEPGRRAAGWRGVTNRRTP